MPCPTRIPLAFRSSQGLPALCDAYIGPHKTIHVNPKRADWDSSAGEVFEGRLIHRSVGVAALSRDAVSKAVAAKVKDGVHCHLHFAPAAPQKSHRRPPSTQAESLCVLAGLNLACWLSGCAPASGVNSHMIHIQRSRESPPTPSGSAINSRADIRASWPPSSVQGPS